MTSPYQQKVEKITEALDNKLESEYAKIDHTHNDTYTADNSTLELSSNQFKVKSGGITSSHIADGTIVNGDIASNAAIAYSKLSGVAPTAHTNQGNSSTYGAANGSTWGHVRLTNSYETNGGASANGIAASGQAVYDAYTTLKTSLDGHTHKNLEKTIITSGDLNDYTTSGWYIYSGANSNNISNTPMKIGSIMEVLDEYGDGRYVVQRVYTLPSDKNSFIYYRQKYDPDWGNWIRIDGKDKALETHTHKDTDITYNGSKSYGVSAIDMTLLDEAGGNRLAFLKPENITIKYSTDAGANWSSWNGTAAYKTQLVTTSRGFYAGNGATASKNNQLQVIINAGGVLDSTDADLYCQTQKLLMYTTYAGSCKVEVAKYASPSTWEDKGTFSINGSPNWNSIPLSVLLGGYKSQLKDDRYQYIRLTFFTTNNVNMAISKLRLFASTSYIPSSGFGYDGHMYSYDENKNVTFPAKIIKSGGTSSQFLKADGSVDESSYLKIAQGTNQSGKFLKVNSNGNITCESVTSMTPTTHQHSYADLTNKPSYTATVTSSTTGAYKMGSINISGSNVDIYGKDTNTTYTAESTVTNIKKDGKQAVGSLTTYARGDHVHPRISECVWSNHAAGTNNWTGECSYLTSVEKGTVIYFSLRQAPTTDNAVLRLKLADGTYFPSSTTYSKIYFQGDYLTNQFGQYSLIGLVYDGANWTTISNYKDTNTTYSAATSSANGLLTSTDFNAIADYKAGKTKVTEITASGSTVSPYTNFNDYKTPGFYSCVSNNTTKLMSNTPWGNQPTNGQAFALIILKHAGVRQIVMPFGISDPNIYIRNFYNNSWGGWYTVCHSGNLNNTVTSTSTTQAATANAVRIAYEKADSISAEAGVATTDKDKIGSVTIGGTEYSWYTPKLNDTISSTNTNQAATANAVRVAYEKGNHSHPSIANNLTTSTTGSVLDATQGKWLKDNTVQTAGTGMTKSGNTLGVKNFALAFAAQTGKGVTVKTYTDGLSVYVTFEGTASVTSGSSSSPSSTTIVTLSNTAYAPIINTQVPARESAGGHRMKLNSNGIMQFLNDTSGTSFSIHGAFYYPLKSRLP